MEEVYNPYTNQAPYTPAQPPYNPAAAPAVPNSMGMTAAGQGQGQWPPQAPPAPAPAPQQQPPNGYGVPAQPPQGQYPNGYGQPQGQPAGYQQPPQGGYQQPPQGGPQGYQQPPQQQPQQPQIPKLPTQSGQPVKGMNLSVIEGYINSPKATDMGNGNMRLGFFMVWEMQVWENGQPKRDAYGNIEIRNVRYLCQAWGDLARTLASLPEGTPIKLFGMLNRWNAARQNEQPNWITDIKATKYEPL